MRAGYIGLGAMGHAMAANLHQAGLLTAVWNRTFSKAEAFAAETGVTAAESPARLAELCDVVFINVSADRDVLEMVDAVAPWMGEGEVVVDCSTVSSDTARTAAEKLAAQSAGFLDAPVTGGVEGARKASLSIMVGGDPALLEQVRPALEAMGSRVTPMGPVGSGQATKAVNQIMVAGVAQGVTEALAFGQAMGLDMDKVMQVVSGGAAGNWFLDHRGPSMLADKFDVGFKVALHNKDLKICQRMADARGVHLEVVDDTLSDYARLLDDGFGEEDISALFRLKRAQFRRG